MNVVGSKLLAAICIHLLNESEVSHRTGAGGCAEIGNNVMSPPVALLKKNHIPNTSLFRIAGAIAAGGLTAGRSFILRIKAVGGASEWL
jgi:hypothetical protein